jgi:membrane-associated phospholipid phosphatase
MPKTDSEIKKFTFLWLFSLYFLVGLYPALLNHIELHLWFNKFHFEELNSFFSFITYLGDGLGWVIFCIIFLFISFKGSLFIFLSGLLSGTITQVLKRFVFNDINRPLFYFKPEDLPTISGIDNHMNFSFPSGHSTSAFALFFTLSLIINKPKISIGFFFLAFLAAFSRIYLHQHFYRDTYVGAFIGVVSTLVIYYWFYKKVNEKPKWSKSLLSPKI